MPQWQGIEDSSSHPVSVWLAREQQPQASTSTSSSSSSSNADGTSTNIAGTKAVTAATTSTSSEWKPLRKSDCRRLNEAYSVWRDEQQKEATSSPASVAAAATTAIADLLSPSSSSFTTTTTAASSSLSRVHVEGGRTCADFVSNTLTYNFVRGPIRDLCAATWFLRLGNSAASVVTNDASSPKSKWLIPVMNPSDTDLIEKFYQSAVEASSSLGPGVTSLIGQQIVLSDESTVTLVKTSDQHLVLKRAPPKGWFVASPSHTLQRGYGDYTVEGEDVELQLGPVRTLIFVVHGVGENLFSRDDSMFPSLLQQASQIRSCIQTKQVQEWKRQCQVATAKSKKNAPPELMPPPPNRIEIIPIEWFDKVHDSSTSLMQSLRAATLPTIPALRAIANDVVFDVLMYLTPAFCETTLEYVTAQIRDLYAKFLQVHPDFAQAAPMDQSAGQDGEGGGGGAGQCYLVGHSLGSVICWDLLSILKDHQDSANNINANALGTNALLALGPPAESAAPAATDQDRSSYLGQHGTWGPTLTKKMQHTIPFTPQTTIFLGSPLGLFLTLRGAHAVFDAMRTNSDRHNNNNNHSSTTMIIAPSDNTQGPDKTHSAAVGGGTVALGAPMVSPFVLPTKRLYNIFHPSDPIAYRIETLLLPPDLASKENLIPPPAYLTTPGKDVRLHVKAKQLGNEIRKSFLDPANSPWAGWLDTAVSSVFSTDHANATARSPTITRFPLGGKNDRVDFSLQPSVIDNEYISAVMAHSSYFAHEDIHDFLVGLVAMDEKEGKQ